MRNGWRTERMRLTMTGFNNNLVPDLLQQEHADHARAMKALSSCSSPSAGSARRIFVHPGHVVSRTDGDLHFIPAGRLAELYGVRLRDCIVVDKHDPQNHQHGYKNRDGDIHLYPRRDGDYRRVPNVKVEAER